jgi:hypothetical protein
MMDESFEADPPPDQMIQHLIDADGNGNVDKNSAEHRMLVFLYDRGVPQHFQYNPDKKAELFREILTEGNEGRERLMQILQLLDDHDTGNDHHLHCPDTWLPKYPFNSDSGLQQWIPALDNVSNCRLLTIFNEFKPNQAKQSLANNCYIVAAATCHTYAVKRATKVWTKVDVSTYILHSFSHQKFFDRIMLNKGGQAFEVFEDLSEHDGVHINRKGHSCSLTKENCFTYLRNHGAALLSEFHVDEDFRLVNKFSFTGSVKVDLEKTTWHAMVLVGVREDKSGQCWLLVQNWWEGKQFVEMTLEYLKSSNAVLHFSLKEHTKVCEPFNASMTHCLFTEADIDDGGDVEDDYLWPWQEGGNSIRVYLFHFHNVKKYVCKSD